MSCVMCKAELTSGVANHVVDMEGNIIVIKNVPVNICNQCGEYYFDHEIAVSLEEIVEQARSSGAKITIINYSDKVA